MERGESFLRLHCSGNSGRSYAEFHFARSDEGALLERCRQWRARCALDGRDDDHGEK